MGKRHAPTQLRAAEDAVKKIDDAVKKIDTPSRDARAAGANLAPL
jgi:hypothetical protein